MVEIKRFKYIMYSYNQAGKTPEPINLMEGNYTMKRIITITLLSLFTFATVVAAGGDENIDSILSSANGKVYYVSAETGNNRNPGTAEKPYKNIDKVLKKAKKGDTILVAEGRYGGTFGIGYFEMKNGVRMYGGFSKDFKNRDHLKYPTLIQPDNKSAAKSRKPLLTIKEIDGVVVNGFIFDMGMRNSYDPKKGKPAGLETGMLLLPPAHAPGEKASVLKACISIPSSAREGDIKIMNNLFSNCANFAIQAGLRGGRYEIVNNVFVANRMGAIEIYGTCRKTGGPKNMNKCGEVEIAYNTILFTWSRTKDYQDMGYGISIMTRAGYHIHHNLIGGNVMTGINHTRFNKDEWIKLDNNRFFVNKVADLEYSPESNTVLNLSAAEFADLEFASVEGNSDALPKGLPIDKAYLEGFLSARYTESTDYNPDSQANQLRELFGMNKQGKMTSSASMYANRYSWKEAIKLFRAISNLGAQ